MTKWLLIGLAFYLGRQWFTGTVSIDLGGTTIGGKPVTPTGTTVTNDVPNALAPPRPRTQVPIDSGYSVPPSLPVQHLGFNPGSVITGFRLVTPTRYLVQ